MNLLIDIGNTAIKLALAENNIITKIYRSNTNSLFTFVENIVKNNSLDIIALSSVKDIDNILFKLLEENSNKFLKVDNNLNLPLKNKYKTPKTLGVDRMCAVIGAYSLFPGENIMVIDIGTAITYDFINSKNEYMGGNISPGFNIRTKALNKYTDKLPLVNLTEDFLEIGDNTSDAIKSGIIIGIVNEIEGYLKKYPKFKVIFTGGDAFYFAKKMKTCIFVVCNIVLNGLLKIIEINA
ncbi:MAG: type III pantothenate kinase [Bacteroidales bacterium]